MEETLPALKRTLADLVSMDTTSTRPNRELVDYAEARLRKAGYETERQRYVDDMGVEKFNLVAARGGSSHARAALALVGHTDCVPYDEAWTEALRLVEREGRLYARGACDTKGFIACALHAAEHMASARLREPLVLLLTADEERRFEGIKHLVDSGLGRAKQAIVGEPTSLTPVRAHKGYCLAEVEVVGREGHSSYPDAGASAIFRAGRFLHRLEALALTYLREERHEGFDPPFTTVNVGLIHGGKAPNVIPGACRFQVEWRPIPGQPVEKVLELLVHIRQELEQHDPAYEARVKVLQVDPGVDTPAGAEVVQLLSRLSGREAITVPFGTEAPHVKTGLGAEAVVFGPGSIHVAHQTGEYVPAEDLVRCEAHLIKAIEHFCTGR